MVPLRRWLLPSASILSLAQLAEAQGSLAVGSEEMPGMIASISAAPEEPTIEALVAWGERTDRAAVDQLLLWSRDRQILDEHGLRLALVVALDRHSGGVRRDEILRALVALSEPDAPGVLFGALASPAGEQPRGSLYRARAAALFALARSEDEKALAVLVALGADGDQLDPIGARLARQALLTVPETTLADARLPELVDPELVSRALGAEEKTADAPGTPEALVSLAPGDPKSPDALVAFENALRELERMPHLPTSFADPAAWRQAVRANRTWTLRSLTCLSRSTGPQVARAAVRLARASIESKDATERSAAAWALSVFAPERAVDLLASGDAVVRMAILSQATQGELARKAHALSLVPKALSADEKYIATRMSAWEPSVWTSLATQTLFSQPDGTKVPGFSAALAARVQPLYESGTPSAQLVREWLDAGDLETRAATAHGLGAARGASAAGLILHAYWRETAPEVRRALAGSMLRHPDLGPRRARAIVRLDEDAATRLRANLASRESVTTFTIQLSTRKRETFLDPEGRRLWVAPAPDGFIGVVHR